MIDKRQNAVHQRSGARPLVLAVAIGVLVIAAGCGSDADPVTAPDREAAVTAVLSELPEITAEVMTREQIDTEGGRVCALLADFDGRPAVSDVMQALLDETWSDPVETDFHPEEIQASFLATVEGPYVLSLSRHFCPDQAVRTNII